MQVKNIILALTACLQFAYALPAGVNILSANNEGAIANKFIVVLKENLPEAAVAAHVANVEGVHALSAREVAPGRHFSGISKSFKLKGLRGYSGEFDDATLSAIAKSPEVAYIEADQIYNAIRAPRKKAVVTQNDATWGLARLSAGKSWTGTQTTYKYDSSAGQGVNVYVVDTGTQETHDEFEGRVRWLGDYSGERLEEDGNGHGTHCSGTVAGKTYGVAKKASIVAVKVLTSAGSGSTSGIVKALEAVAGDVRKQGKPGVVSMSLGGGYSAALNRAVASLVDSGITTVVAAGNEGQNARNVSPASEPKVITVGATDINDRVTSWSNYGAGVDIFAPGNQITSAWIGSDDATDTIDGTSMACPHVAGLAAYIISLTGDSSPSGVQATMNKWALSGKLTNIRGGSPNRLLQNNGGARL